MEVFMNNRIKLFGIIALVAVIGFSMAACGDDSGGGGSFYVTYNGNGSTGGEAPADIKKYSNEEIVTVKEPGSLEKEDHYFSKWSNKADGSGDSWGPLDSFPIESDVTLYAQWEPYDPGLTFYRVTYDGNGNTGGTAPIDNIYYEPGYETSVMDWGALEKDGYIFDKWTTEANGEGGLSFNPGDHFAVMADVTLYAQWTPEKPETTYYTVFFAASYAKAPASITVEAGTTVTQPPTPEKTGDFYNAKFRGWSQYEDLYSAWNFSVKVTRTMTLYAFWQPYAIGDTGPGGGKIVYRNSEGFTRQSYIIVRNGVVTPVFAKTCYYLEAAPVSNLSINYCSWASYNKGEENIPTNATRGYGMQNSRNIIQKDPGAWVAAKYCLDYQSGAKNDWFLPSERELLDLNTNLAASGYSLHSGKKFWTSNQVSTTHARVITLGAGTLSTEYKYDPPEKGGGNHIIPMRAF